VRIALAGAIASLVLVAGACGSSPAKVTASVTGGTKAERSLAREILQKLAPSPVTSVRFRGLQHDAIHHWPGRRMDVHGPTATIQQEWEQALFGYSYALVALDRHVPIGFVTLDTGYGSLDSALSNAPRKPISDSALRAYEGKLRSSARAAHASIWFRELRPGPVALEVTVTTSKPAPLLKYHLAPFERQPAGVFRFLLLVVRPNGEIAFGRGSGMSTWDRRLLGCLTGADIPQPTMSNVAVPPCPA
jgi:hypothetical protein